MSTEADLRKEHYGLLRWGLLPVAPGAWDVVTSPVWFERLRFAGEDAGITGVNRHLDGLREGLATLKDRDAWEGAYHETFGRRVQVSLNETDYTSTHVFMQSQDLADVAGFYRAFGFHPADALGERPDHLGVELEFLHVLALKEAALVAHGDAEGAHVCRDATRKFLEVHAGRFVGRLQEVLDDAGAHAFFRHHVALTRAFIDRDVKALNVNPPPPPAWENAVGQPSDVPGCDACPVVPQEGGDAA